MQCCRWLMRLRSLSGVDALLRGRDMDLVCVRAELLADQVAQCSVVVIVVVNSVISTSLLLR